MGRIVRDPSLVLPSEVPSCMSSLHQDCRLEPDRTADLLLEDLLGTAAAVDTVEAVGIVAVAVGMGVAVHIDLVAARGALHTVLGVVADPANTRVLASFLCLGVHS